MPSAEGIAALLTILVLLVWAKKDTKVEDLLKTEEDRLKKNGIECGAKSFTKQIVNSLRLKQQSDDRAVICMIKYLQNNPKDGFMWTALGAAFEKAGKKSSNQANLCFKQAAKISGKFPTFIKDWHYIGPFVIGKTEFDGDPVEAFGGIDNISRYRYDEVMAYPTEVVPHGKVTWSKLKQQAEDQAVKVAPDVDWNDLVRSLGSLGITEWQGWAVGEMAINHDELTVLVQCLGVATVFIDGIPITGDLYHRDHFYFSLRLTRGVHLVSVKLRAKVQAVFQCSFKTPPKDGFQVFKPTFQPDLFDGYLFSQYLSFPIANHRSEKWLKIIKVSVSGQSSGEGLRAEVINNQFSIAPGQTRPITVKLSSENPRISDTCENVPFTVVIKTSEGQDSSSLTLRCRKNKESFLFTFLDHDGSVQHAAAVAPIGGCAELDHVCPTLLTLHGTTVPPQNQADSYKRMVGGEYQFGVRGMWLLAPTRHGAHNWEGPGALTAMTALERLSSLTLGHAWIQDTADSQHVLFEGHSMGGHGAWHLATHFPDRAIGLAALAGWIKKEEYGDSNLFFKHDIATSHTDASVKAVMEACIGENDADRHVSNLWKIPVLCRIGGNDRTVHPFFTRRMYRLLQEGGSKVTLTELDGREHWWWDTWETNDGGVVNDRQMRAFAADCLSAHTSQTKAAQEQGTCDKEAGCKKGTKGVWGRREEGSGVWELVTINPAFGEGLRGMRVLQQTVPFRTSKIKINITDEKVYLTTTNVKKFTLTEPPNRAVHWRQKQISVDRQPEVSGEALKPSVVTFCKVKGQWSVCSDEVQSEKQRGPLTQGPARRVAEQTFVIVVGTQGKQAVTEKLQAYAVYVANLFYLTSDTTAPVVKDVDVTEQHLENTNVLLVGGPEQNLFSQQFLDKVPVRVKDRSIQLGDCTFSEGRQGMLTLAPNGATHLAMVLMGSTMEGLADVISLATPTIPPMARSPFSNLLPDFVLTGDRYGREGPGGFLCAGFWGNQWELRQDLTSCACAAS